MIVQLSDNIEAEIVIGELSITSTPRWNLPDLWVNCGSYGSDTEHDHHIRDKVGAFNYWWANSDEMCFDDVKNDLQSIMLHVPEVNIASPSDLNFWLDVPQQKGTLRLVESKRFVLKPTAMRWFMPNSAFLFCVSERAQSNKKNNLRLCIASDLELLFVDTRLCGWLLQNPSRYIVESWEQTVPNGSSGSIDPSLYEYLQLVTLANIELIEDRNPQVFQTLRKLYSQLETEEPDEVQIVLRHSLERLANNFGKQNIDI